MFSHLNRQKLHKMHLLFDKKSIFLNKPRSLKEKFIIVKKRTTSSALNDKKTPFTISYSTKTP